MPDLIKVQYAQTGKSAATNPMGMREMQARAYAARGAQYLLLKAPPASGKSRALMFLALDKLRHQGIRKVIVAVPERSIGGSFSPAPLSEQGFFADWAPQDRYNLCTPGSDGSRSKVEAFRHFMHDPAGDILICTHATLRFAYETLSDNDFDGTLVAIDEFHHVSSSDENRLGELLRSVMAHSTAHIVAMTGSYFRGDTIAVLHPDDEAKFTKVTYNYYEQLNGYKHLKSLGIGYHFYQGKYTTAIGDILDTDKKTILHIPNVNSGESLKDKYREVDIILDHIGDDVSTDPESGIISVKRHRDGKIIRVADLVNDNPKTRERVVAYLRTVSAPEDLDLIIALGMAKEGFDWPFCEHALTVGYRGSLTEIIQIIGRATRDSTNKTHAQFTNLIAQPDAADDAVKLSVNNMLKAITASLLMEQVLAPTFQFKTKLSDEDRAEAGEIKVGGFKAPSTQKVKDIIESDLNDLKATILQDNTMLKAMPGNVDAEVINRVLIPKIIQTKYPDLTEAEVEEVRQYVVIDSVIRSGEIMEQGDQRFIRMAGQFVNIDDLHIDLIDRINPFQKAFEILSKSVTPKVLKVIQETIEATRISMDFEEAAILWPKIQAFIRENSREPNLNTSDPLERRMAECIIYLKEEKRKQMAQKP